MKRLNRPEASPKKDQHRQWWVPTLGFGIALLLLLTNGWVSRKMTSQFREYSSTFLQAQTAEALRGLWEEESQLIRAIPSLMRGRSSENILSEEFAILFMFDLAVIYDAESRFLEGYTFTDEGRHAIKPETPMFDMVDKADTRRRRSPLSFHMVSMGKQVYVLYLFRDPVGRGGNMCLVGRRMPSEFTRIAATANSAYRVIPETIPGKRPPPLETWNLSEIAKPDIQRNFTRRREPPRPGMRPSRPLPPEAPATLAIMRHPIRLSPDPVSMDNGMEGAVAYASIRETPGSGAVRIELLVSRDFTQKLESTLRSIHRNATGVGFLIILFTLIVVTEMRRRKKAELHLKDRNQQLDEANQRKDRLLAIISHDLRAPLSGVSNLSGLLMKQPESFTHSEIRKFAGDIQSTSKHLTELLDNLLNWARLQTGQLPYFPGRIDMERVAHQIKTLFISTAKERNVALVVEIASSTEMVNDVEMLRVILRNLFSNAIRHTASGGTVKMRQKMIGKNIMIEVQDNGEGMTQAQSDQLFKLPEKAHDPTEAGKKGAGFGLVLSKKLAHRMGGDLTVETTPGEGTTFRVELPTCWLPEDLGSER
jgi:signal transduction histidine kinase